VIGKVTSLGRIARGILASEFTSIDKFPFSTGIREIPEAVLGTGETSGITVAILASCLVCCTYSASFTAVGRTCAEQHRARAASNGTLDFIVLNTSTSEYITWPRKAAFCGVLQRERNRAIGMRC
jgi:hypothetical protein